ncbi:uncharacterized protein LOC105285208 [Ooceraea biroi]|uniref:uncharacterized protein LOC105285208 n=1 Tax=Ooceraea biroi TaxID=2015173 RepID=UPI000F08D883|nr:uncharacterized protein LOC105285208 [Ooceraea biroi]
MSLHTKNLLKALSPETVKNMVKNELQTYDADKTGRTDYALESSGFAISKNIFLLFYTESVLIKAQDLMVLR